MADVVAFQAPAAVEYDGQALTVVAQLSKIAVELSEIQTEVPPELQHRLDNTVRTLNAIILMMTAVEETISVIEDSAEEILNIVKDGEEAAFLNISSTTLLNIGGENKKKMQYFACSTV